jgi:hypothetical protein
LLTGSSTSFAQTQDVICPSLTASDIQSIIDSGTISTDQGYSLADEAGMTRAQVLMNEPTANPFDTYYRIMGEKKISLKLSIHFSMVMEGWGDFLSLLFYA